MTEYGSTAIDGCMCSRCLRAAAKGPKGVAGTKNDTDKPEIVTGALHYFPRAIAMVAVLSKDGMTKYGSANNWRLVPDGQVRYTNALGRHLAALATDGNVDPSSGRLHLAHAAWNALAALELLLTNTETNK